MSVGEHPNDGYAVSVFRLPVADALREACRQAVVYAAEGTARMSADTVVALAADTLAKIERGEIVVPTARAD